MTGLFGFVGHPSGVEPDSLMANMAHALAHKDWHQTNIYHDSSVGLGRVSLGILNPQPQPIWNEDESIAIIMEGELFDYEVLKEQLISRGHQFRVNNDAEFALHLYEEYGEDFVTQLNGAFVAAIWDQRLRILVVVNDIVGTRPLYYVRHNLQFTFASGVRALMADPVVPRKVDSIAVAQMLSFEYVLGDRTLLENVKVLPPGSLLIFRDGRCMIRPYCELKFAGSYNVQDREMYLEGLNHHLQLAIARQEPGKAPAGINLSGGLDSRTVLGLLTAGSTSNGLHTFTFGIPGCDDARIARELAAKAGTHHHFLQLNPDYLLDVAEEGVRLTDGMESCVHMHALANVDAQAKHADIIYTGYLADSLISPVIQREWLAKYDDDVAYKLLYDDINVLFLNKNKDELFAEDFQKQIDADSYESFRSVASEAKAESFADWHNQFDIQNRQRRFIGNGSELLRGQVVCRTPFTDKDLVEFTMSIPPGLRLDRFLFKKALATCCHDLSKIPWEKTGLPLVPCIREVRLRIDQQARWQMQRLGLRKWIGDRKRRPYADYGTWMRTSLRGWVEETLLGARSRDRGYFNPDYIGNLVKEHVAGADHSRELGILITLEKWHRQFLD